MLERVNATGFSITLMEYIKQDGMVIGVSTGSLLFSNNLVGNLGLINTRLDVHCPNGEERGKGEYPLKEVLLSLRYARDSRTTDSTVLPLSHKTFLTCLPSI